MPFITPQDTAQNTFDYVVIGGGTAGLTVAGRLSEDPTVSVLVLEAGQKNLDDPLIDIPAQFGRTFRNPQYEWTHPVSEQKNTGRKDHVWYRGKGLGGSSGINFYLWSKPPARDVDAIEKLGNPGWNWSEYIKYSKKSETFHPPGHELTALYPHTFNPAFRGTDGPIQVTIPHHVHTFDKVFQETMVNKGLKVVEDPYGGDINGTWIASANLDPRTWTRSYAANAYMTPNLSRKNLSILTEAIVARILFEEAKTPQDEKIAKGVEFIHQGVTYTAKVNKEVVLSAGAVKSPQVLELSGIGNPQILQQIGVDVRVDLPGVGENVQEHCGFMTSFELDPAKRHETLDLLADPFHAEKARELHAIGQGLHRSGMTSVCYFPHTTMNRDDAAIFVDNVEKEIQEAEQGGTLKSSLLEQLRLQIAALKDDTNPDCQFLLFPGLFSFRRIPEPGKSYFTMIALLNHPISRGTIHAKDSDPLSQPNIDPHYFQSKNDLNMLVRHMKFIKEVRNTEPLRSHIIKGLDPVVGCDSDAEIQAFIKSNLFSIYHTVGSCSMLPREKQGVVDPKLRVYGTKNLRIVDLSIIPLHIAAHTQATAYMIGEKAADLIRADI